MKPLLKYFLALLVMELFIIISGFLIVRNFKTGVELNEILVLSVVFTFISSMALVIFFRGQSEEPAAQTMYTLVSISLKFLIELVFAVLWFIITKKTGPQSVLLFFVLYLAFTLFSLYVILKTLKNRLL